MTDLRFAYLHGFGSSPESYKGTWLREAFAERGLPFELPDLNRPTPETLTYTSALAAIDELVAANPGRWCFVASSMGGYLGARWAQLNPGGVERLLLLCPGFHLVDRWPHVLGQDTFDRWREFGTTTFEDHYRGRDVDLHWKFIEDARRHPPYPDVTCPTRIVHGVRDEVVPIESSRTYAETRDHVSLVEVDDDHGLAASVERIRDEAFDFFL